MQRSIYTGRLYADRFNRGLAAVPLYTPDKPTPTSPDHTHSERWAGARDRIAVTARCVEYRHSHQSSRDRHIYTETLRSTRSTLTPSINL